MGCVMADSEEKNARIDAIMRAYQGDAPGACVLVVARGDAVLRRAYGCADLERRVRASLPTNYRLASMSKAFTAVAALLLAEEGRLDLAAPVGRWFPRLPDAARAATILQLLTHTSGILDYEEIITRGSTAQLCDADVLVLLESAKRSYFTPGTGYRYSNSGYVLLGLVLAAVSGMDFDALLEERVFAPLGMHRTLAHREGLSAPAHRAFGYSLRGEIWERTDQDLTSATLGDGGVYSSIEDLEKWIAAIDEGRLLRPDSWKLAFAPVTPTDREGTSYGLGWRITADSVWHSGETVGFRNVMVRFPRQRLTVVVLTNRNDPEPYATALAIAELWLRA
jgi:CubicO group peptidase (beta-lactamase class C family)